FFKALRKPVLQFFTLLIEEKNAEHLVVDEAFEQFGDALEQFVQIENRRKFARDLVQQKQGTSLASDAGVQSRILDAHRHARSDQRQQAFVLFGEVTLFAGLEVNHADDTVFHDQRDGEFGVHIGQGVDEKIIFRSIGDQHG